MAFRMSSGPRRSGVRRPGSLGAKLVLILTGVGVIGSIALTVLLILIITPSFNTLERQAVGEHVERTRAAMGEFASKVESAVRDYGDWNDSYDYMAEQTRAFEEDSFSTLALVNLGMNGMAYVGNDGRIVIARWLDLDTEADMPAMRGRFEEQIRGFDLKAALKGRSSGSFYARIGGTLAAVGVAQVRRSDGSGSPRGYVLMARAISSQQLSALLQLKARLGKVQAGGEPSVVPHDRNIDIAVPIAGADGKPVATAAYSVPRDLSRLGRRMLMFAVIGSSILLAVVLMVLRRIFGRLVLKPIGRVEQHMGVVRQSGQLGLLTEEPRRDEIGSLVTSFNSMLRQLKDLREQLEMQSFKLGRSESAVAVMHNVRNALNPISTILSQGLAETPSVDRAMLDRALSELVREDIPAARRQKLAAFVAAALESEAAERAERRQQLEIGRGALHNVLEIIGKQQADAHEKPQLDATDISEIIAQNATIVRYSGQNSIAFSFPGKPHWVLANRVILSQVIGNLFANAVEAITAAGREGGTIAVSVEERDGQVRIVIRDDGEGFDPAVGATLFQRGFSTREHKSGGLGLHWCANSMIAMQGALALDSDGKGTGARAVITLPAAPGMAQGEEMAA